MIVGQDFTLLLACYIFTIQTAGYVIKGLIGFGNPLLTGPLLSMWLDNSVITPGNLVIDAPTNAYIVWKNRKSFEWRRMIPLTLAVLAGVVPGTLLLKLALPWVIKAILGILVLAIGIEMATRDRYSMRSPHPAVQYVVAFISGIFAGLYGINLLIVAYLERTSDSHSAFKGSICLLFCAENLFRIILYLLTGIFTKASLILALLTLPAAGLGIWISSLLEPRISKERFKQGVLVLFLFSGASILVKALVLHA